MAERTYDQAKELLAREQAAPAVQECIAKLYQRSLRRQKDTIVQQLSIAESRHEPTETLLQELIQIQQQEASLGKIKP